MTGNRSSMVSVAREKRKVQNSPSHARRSSSSRSVPAFRFKRINASSRGLGIPTGRSHALSVHMPLKREDSFGDCCKNPTSKQQVLESAMQVKVTTGFSEISSIHCVRNGASDQFLLRTSIMNQRRADAAEVCTDQTDFALSCFSTRASH